LIYTRITEVTVCALPDDHINYDLYAVQVQWRGGETHAVVRHKRCLNAAGEWDWEPLPSSRTDEWIADHRFDYHTALRLAAEVAPSVKCNGVTAAEEAGRA
jgi:hypothetical protein